jgi:hypothetical protein
MSLKDIKVRMSTNQTIEELMLDTFNLIIETSVWTYIYNDQDEIKEKKYLSVEELLEDNLKGFTLDDLDKLDMKSEKPYGFIFKAISYDTYNRSINPASETSLVKNVYIVYL